MDFQSTDAAAQKNMGADSAQEPENLDASLLEASQIGQIDTARKLLAQGASVNTRVKASQNTPLILASHHARNNFVRMLSATERMSMQPMSAAETLYGMPSPLATLKRFTCS